MALLIRTKGRRRSRRLMKCRNIAQVILSYHRRNWESDKYIAVLESVHISSEEREFDVEGASRREREDEGTTSTGNISQDATKQSSDKRVGTDQTPGQSQPSVRHQRHFYRHHHLPNPKPRMRKRMRKRKIHGREHLQLKFID